MRTFAFGFAVLIGGAVTLTSGCGDDTESNAGTGATSAGGGGSTSGGNSSTGGTTSGGPASTGGANTGDAGAGNPIVAGAPAEGGTATTGGAPAGAGGAGFMNPEGCPEAAPATNDACSVELDLQQTCEYPGSRCVCNGFTGGGGAGGAMAGNWVCRGDGADCPDPAPATDDECNQNGARCPYPGDINCFCAAGSWTCDDPALGQGGAGNTRGECPAEEPADTDPCQGPINACLYQDTGTLCNCPGAGPNADEWNCEGI